MCIRDRLGSPDNVLIGLNGKWNFLERFQLYGQFLLDEFNFTELFVERRGWWANKYGYQAGIKYIDAFDIDQLDLQLETNTVRPYTYTHFDSTSVYNHFQQPLAHPAGANFREFIGILKYQPVKNLFLEIRAISMRGGESAPGFNWGDNIILSSDTREQNFNNELFQGETFNTFTLSGTLSHQLFHNCFADLNYYQRNKDSILDSFDQETTYIGLGFRLNSGLLRLDY